MVGVARGEGVGGVVCRSVERTPTHTHTHKKTTPTTHETGTCTLIGTSTNLVVSGLQQEAYAKLGDKAPASDTTFGIFDITPYGFPYAAW